MKELQTKKRKRRSDYKALVKCAELNIIKTFTDFMGFNYQIIAPDGEFVKTNKTMEEKIPTGKKAGEIDPVAWADCEKVMVSGKTMMTEEKYGDIWYLSFKHPLNINGVCHGILVISIDVTEKKEAEIAVRKNNGGN